MAHQPIKPTTYLVVYVALLALTATTAYIATYLHLGRVEIPVALGIASVKTILVGLFFMHLIHSSKLAWISLAVGVLFLVAMISLTLGDYWTRGWVPVRAMPAGWVVF
jgi:cytochrome c oxidase subunit 4